MTTKSKIVRDREQKIAAQIPAVDTWLKAMEQPTRTEHPCSRCDVLVEEVARLQMVKADAVESLDVYTRQATP